MVEATSRVNKVKLWFYRTTLLSIPIDATAFSRRHANSIKGTDSIIRRDQLVAVKCRASSWWSEQYMYGPFLTFPSMQSAQYSGSIAPWPHICLLRTIVGLNLFLEATLTVFSPGSHVGQFFLAQFQGPDAVTTYFHYVCNHRADAGNRIIVI